MRRSRARNRVGHHDAEAVLRGIDDPNLWFPCMFVLVFWAVSETSSPAVWRWASVGAVAGVLAAVSLSSANDGHPLRVISAAPRSLVQNVEFLTQGGTEADEFAAERFVKLPSINGSSTR
jgi:hypothetical protein